MINPVDLNTTMFNIQNKNLENCSSNDFKNLEQEKLKEAASNFEAVFVNQFLETVNSTVEKGGMFSGGRGEQMFKSMLNQELSKNIASSPTTSFGFAKQIYEQMKDLV